MMRRAFTIAAALSLLLCLGTLGLWASTQDRDITLAHFTTGGRLNDLLAGRSTLAIYTQRLVWRPGLGLQFGQWEGLCLAVTWYRRDAFTASATLAYPAAVFAVLPLVWSQRFLRRARRRKQGRCLTCGYDLRGSAGTCPECGAERESRSWTD